MKVPIRIKSLNPDRTNYKKYGLMCEPENLVVELEIEDKEVVLDNGVYYVSEAGLKAIVGRLADIVDEIDEAYLKRLR